MDSASKRPLREQTRFRQARLTHSDDRQKSRDAARSDSPKTFSLRLLGKWCVAAPPVAPPAKGRASASRRGWFRVARIRRIRRAESRAFLHMRGIREPRVIQAGQERKRLNGATMSLTGTQRHQNEKREARRRRKGFVESVRPETEGLSGRHRQRRICLRAIAESILKDVSIVVSFYLIVPSLLRNSLHRKGKGGRRKENRARRPGPLARRFGGNKGGS